MTETEMTRARETPCRKGPVTVCEPTGPMPSGVTMVGTTVSMTRMGTPEKRVWSWRQESSEWICVMVMDA